MDFSGHKMMSYAEEDPLEDEAEVEGESDIEEVGGAEDEDEDLKSLASPNADTTILFVKPTLTGSSLGEWMLRVTRLYITLPFPCVRYLFLSIVLFCTTFHYFES